MALSTMALNVMSGFTNNFEKLEFAYDVGRSICHYQEGQSPHFFSKMHAKSNLFTLAEGVTIVVNGIFLIIQLEKNFNHFSRFGYLPSVFTWWLGLNAFAAIAIPVAGATLLNTLILKPIIVDDKSYRAKNNENQMYLTIGKIALNIALFAFSPTNPFYVLNVGFELYSLANVAQRKWIVLTKTIQRNLMISGSQGPFNVVATQMRVYFEFLIRKNFRKFEDDCAICRESDPETFFCDNHMFHLPCIVNSINAKSENLAQSIIITARKILETKHKTNGRHTHSTYQAVYYGKVKKTAVECCSLCRTSPNHNKFIITIDDQSYGSSPTVITWVDS